MANTYEVISRSYIWKPDGSNQLRVAHEGDIIENPQKADFGVAVGFIKPTDENTPTPKPETTEEANKRIEELEGTVDELVDAMQESTQKLSANDPKSE